MAGQFRTIEHINTVVIGAGQAGLSAGYHLQQQRIAFVILEAHQRVGDSWRTRWDSLRLFTPARYDALEGMPFPADPHSFPSKDDMADYLEAYVARFALPVRTGVSVQRLSKQEGKFLVEWQNGALQADNVIVAMASYQKPYVPPFAAALDPGIVQLHSTGYRSPSQLNNGDVLIVGAGNSGAEIAMEVSRTHRTLLSGRDVGHVPFDISGLPARLFLLRLVLRGFFHHVLTVRTPVGRRARPKILSMGGPLIRTRPNVLEAAGVERTPRVSDVKAGKPVLEDGRTIDVANVIWCTGFHPGFSWIDLPVLKNGWPVHERGVVAEEPGLYFVGLQFLYAFSSTMIHGVGRDAEYIVDTIVARDGHAAVQQARSGDQAVHPSRRRAVAV